MSTNHNFSRERRADKLTSRYEMANKPKIKEKECMVKKEGKKEKTTTTLSEKKEEASNVSKQWDKGWIHVIRVHDTTHLAVTTRQGNRRSQTTPYKERMRGLVKHQDYPPHSYIINERYTQETKGQAKRKNSEWQEPVTSTTPNPNPRRPWKH